MGSPCFSASNAAKLADNAEDIQRMLATMCSTVAMTNHLIENHMTSNENKLSDR